MFAREEAKLPNIPGDLNMTNLHSVVCARSILSNLACGLLE